VGRYQRFKEKNKRDGVKENVSGGYNFREAPWIEEERQQGADE
jgi:hypothetical protein